MMNEQIREAIENIFSDYENTLALQDFKEEISINLYERITDMTKKGVSQEKALDLALEELGDVTEAADAVSRQKRQEIIGQAYGSKVVLDKVHAFGYTIAGLVLAFGIIVSAIVGFTEGRWMDSIAVLMPFATPAAGGFVFLALTQETRTHNPMSRKRSLVYTAATMYLVFGLFISAITFFTAIPVEYMISEHQGFKIVDSNMVASLGVLIPFVLPGLAVLAFLLFTEKSRKKLWLVKGEEEQVAKYHELSYDLNFGLLSGALWIAAIGVLFLLGLTAGWHIAWVVILFAIAGQCLVQFFYAKALK